MRAADDDSPAPALGKAVAPTSEPFATTIVGNTPGTSDDMPLARLRNVLRLRRHGRCDWRRQDWRSTGGLAPWHCATCGQTGYAADGDGPTSCNWLLTAGRL